MRTVSLSFVAGNLRCSGTVRAVKSSALGNAAQDSGQEDEDERVEEKRDREPFLSLQPEIFEEQFHGSKRQRAICRPDQLDAFEAGCKQAKANAEAQMMPVRMTARA